MTKAFVTSIGEPTTDLCVWSLKRQHIDVELVNNKESLARKLEYIYNRADDDFLRVDADVIPNNNILNLLRYKHVWWVQGRIFDLYKNDVINGGVQFIHKEAIQSLRETISKHINDERPETGVWREESINPLTFTCTESIYGLHGFAQNNLDRVIATKTRRNQLDDYDFELTKRMQEFYV